MKHLVVILIAFYLFAFIAALSYISTLSNTPMEMNYNAISWSVCGLALIIIYVAYHASDGENEY